jgi:hypothetical protein
MAAGAALYGKNWEGQMAADLNESETLVTQWANGRRLMPVPAQNRIARLLDKRLVAISTVLDQIG